MRQAVYFTPAPAHPLWRAGCEWLGRDPGGGAASLPARPMTAAPWRYGFHATFKAPLCLAHGCTEAAWLAAVEALAQRHAVFAMPPLQVAVLGDFLALRPVPPIAAMHPLRRLADACVIELDDWRAPPRPDELQRRARAGLSDRQRGHLHRYGYPHVLEDWRFHLTLSDAGDPGSTAMRALQAQARAHFAAALQAPLTCDALSVFVEPAPGAAFVLTHRFALRDA